MFKYILVKKKTKSIYNVQNDAGYTDSFEYNWTQLINWQLLSIVFKRNGYVHVMEQQKRQLFLLTGFFTVVCCPGF